jgi:hypothetical protein
MKKEVSRGVMKKEANQSKERINLTKSTTSNLTI